nr:xylulose kinase-1 [Tanacetum cinerariifolium]
MTLTFADTHNMVAYLSKSDTSKGFDQIIDFINGIYIAYALTVNLTIYVSCIKQFWRTVAVKTSNDVTRLQALVEKKRVVVTEAAIRDALHLYDAEGVDCLPNEEIFTKLACMGYEKPTTKLTFYKAFFSSQWKVGKGYSGVETPLFEGILVAREPEEHGDEQGNEEEQGTADTTAEEPEIAGAHFLMSLLQEALDACATLARRVENLEQDKVAQDLEIIKLNTRVKNLEKTNKAKTLKLRRLRKEESSAKTPTETISKDKGKDLETLWRIVKERFSISKPNNFSDEYLLTALKMMFERPYGQDNVWKNQSTIHGQALVKSWKLLTSCRVHIISFNTT